MPRLPKERRGKNESEEHYLRRLETARQEWVVSRARNVWGQFLSDFDWDWFTTFGFQCPCTSQTATARIEDYLYQCPRCFAFYAIERSASGCINAHALIGNAKDLLMKNSWPHGMSDIKKYDPEKAAAFYVCKSRELEWDWFGSRKVPS